MAWAQGEVPLRQRLAAHLENAADEEERCLCISIRQKAECPNLAISTEKTDLMATFLHQSHLVVGWEMDKPAGIR